MSPPRDKSVHWLWAPHERLLSSWAPFQSMSIADSFRLATVEPAQVNAFIEFENSVRSRRVGAPLIEHLQCFGRHLAFVYLSGQKVVGIQRFRLYHEFDPGYRTLLNAYFHIDPTFQSRGLGATFLRVATRYFQEQGGVDAVASEAWPENEASVRSTLNAGFELSQRLPNGKSVFMKPLGKAGT